MRISRDPDSYRAEGVLRRDFRSSRGEPDVPRHVPATKRKDGRRWCRGHEGREHVAVLVPSWWRTVTVRIPDPEAAGGYRIGTERVPGGQRAECANCGSQRLPVHVTAQVDAKLAKQLALADRWCREGHLRDTVEAVGQFGFRSRRRVCVMCGKVG